MPVGVLLLGLGAPAPAQEAPLPPPDIQRLVAECVAAAPADRPAILERLRPADLIQGSDVRIWVGRILGEIQKRPRPVGKNPTTLSHPEFPMRYAMLGTPKPGDAVLIYLHRCGTDAATNDRGWGLAKSMGPGMGLPVTLAPRVFDDTALVGWAEERAAVAVAAMLDEVKRAPRVDTNRVYLGGYAMGGYATPQVAAVLADRLAACFAFAGGAPPEAPVENLRNTPLAVHIGDQDTGDGRLDATRALRDRLAALRGEDPTGYEAVHREYPGVGHSLPSSAHPEVGAWLKTKRRDPYPKTLVWRPTSSRFRHFHWLWAGPGVEGRIRARVAGPNRIEVEATAGAALTVFLNDRMVDLRKPVVVNLNGAERWNGVVGHSLTALVETLAAKEDPEMYFTARVDLR